jgi:hypothetical protein
MTALTLRHTYERTNQEGVVYTSWALWCAYVPGIVGALVQLPREGRPPLPAVGEVGDWDWSVEPMRVTV